MQVADLVLESWLPVPFVIPHHPRLPLAALLWRAAKICIMMVLDDTMCVMVAVCLY
jgi:hypothetical protein